MHQNGYCYIEKLTLYLAPDGTITLVMGNQRLTLTADEVERLVQSRLATHAVFVQVIRERSEQEVKI